ncbi:MAG: HalOD1 output domain-containing protein [Haloferacaceae archaeon]
MGNQVVAVVIETIAEAEGVDPMNLEYVLNDYVDADALRLLADGRNTSWRLSFETPDHDVSVTGDGWVCIDGKRTNRWRSEDGGLEISA